MCLCQCHSGVAFAGAGAIVLGRLYCEMRSVLFRIAENLTDMNRKRKE